MKTQVIILTLMALTVVGCHTNKENKMNRTDGNQTASATLTEGTWELTQLEGAAVNQSDTDGKKIHFTLNSVDGKVNGFAGCNTFFGEYTLEDGNRIRFSKLANTRMACPDAAINENEVLEVFRLADNYTFNEGTLKLNVGRRAPLAVFRKVSPEEQIVDKYWKLNILDGREVKMAENQEQERYFRLERAENRVTGFAGCNTFSGTYTLEPGGRIRFLQMVTTMKACPDVDVNEAEFLKIFEQTDNFTIQNNMLNLNVGRRAPLAVFELTHLD
jgi:heat shock protein HslJ